MKTNQEIATLLQDIASSSPGVRDITVDGVRITRDMTALDYYERRAARDAIPVTRPIVFSVDLS